MTWLTVIMACALGMMAIGRNGDMTKKEDRKYSYEYCRKNLSVNYYDNWRCEDIAYQLQDNWLYRVYPEVSSANHLWTDKTRCRSNPARVMQAKRYNDH